jgi:hypothetical protein
MEEDEDEERSEVRQEVAGEGIIKCTFQTFGEG